MQKDKEAGGAIFTIYILKEKLLVKINVIKTARIFEKHSKINIDYRINEEYVINGIGRVRFSLGIEYNKKNILELESKIKDLALEHYLKTNKISDSKEIYFKDIAIEALNEEKDNRASDTHEDYIKICEKYILPIFGEMRLVDIKAKDIKAWKNNLLNDKNLSKSRFNKYYRTLNFIIKYSYVNEMIEKNIMDLVDKKSKIFKDNKSSSVKYYTKEEIKMILENSDGWFQVYLSTLFYTGIRTGESLALKWTDIDFENNTITIQRNIRHGKVKNSTKTGIVNIVDMAIPLKNLLIKYRSFSTSSEWLFPNPNTLVPYWESKSIINTYFKPLLKTLNIEYKTLYASRHSFASIMVENNVPLTYIQKQLGHKKLSTTMDFYVKNGLISKNGRDVRIDTMYK